MSAAARVPFDTAGSAGSSSAAPPASASDAPAIIVSNPNAKVALLSPPPPPPRPQQPVVIPPTAEFAAALDAENKQLDVDICTKLANLRKQLTGMKDAVQRMQGIQEKTVDDRAEFEKQIQETSEAAVNHFADGVIGLLGIEVDENIKVLNTEAKKASRAARYASAALDYDDPVATDLYADYFAIVWKRRTQMATGKYWVDYVDKLVGGIEAAELSQEKGLGTRLAEGSNQILSEILGNKAMRQWLGVAPGYALRGISRLQGARQHEQKRGPVSRRLDRAAKENSGHRRPDQGDTGRTRQVVAQLYVRNLTLSKERIIGRSPPA
jgi:hypothetical protein